MWFPGKPRDSAAFGVVFQLGGGKTQTTTAKSEPWGPQQDYLKFGFQEARKIYDSGAPEYFPGQTIAGIDPAQTAALNATEQRAMQGNPLLPQAQGLAADTMGGAFLGAGNPYFSAMADQIGDQVTRKYAQAFSGDDASFGSPAHRAALATGLSNAIAPLAYQNYATERGYQNQAALAAPQLAEADYADLARLGQVGDARRALEQGLINDDIARFNFEQNAPWQRLANYMQMVQGNYGGSNTVTAPTQGGSLGAGLLGAGLMATAMPWGSIGSALGGLGKGGAQTATNAAFGAGAHGLLPSNLTF